MRIEIDIDLTVQPGFAAKALWGAFDWYGILLLGSAQECCGIGFGFFGCFGFIGMLLMAVGGYLRLGFSVSILFLCQQ